MRTNKWQMGRQNGSLESSSGRPGVKRTSRPFKEMHADFQLRRRDLKFTLSNRRRKILVASRRQEQQHTIDTSSDNIGI